MEQIHERLLEMTQSIGVKLEANYCCPHVPGDALIVVVGDQCSDVAISAT